MSPAEMMQKTDEELLALNTKPAAQFLLDRADAKSRMDLHGNELARQGVSWWLDKPANGMLLENFMGIAADLPTTTAPGAKPVATAPAPVSAIDAARAALTPAELEAATARAKASEAKTRHASIQESWQSTAVRIGAQEAAKKPGKWDRTVEKFSR